MARSRYCLVPAGDTATSRRLFDAMGAGCKPVYIGRIVTAFKQLDYGVQAQQTQTIGHIVQRTGQSNLPFRSSLNWSNLISFEKTDCLFSNRQAGARALAQRLSAPEDEAAFEAGCRQRLTAYRSALSYFSRGGNRGAGGSGVASALLIELYGRRVTPNCPSGSATTDPTGMSSDPTAAAAQFPAAPTPPPFLPPTPSSPLTTGSTINMYDSELVMLPSLRILACMIEKNAVTLQHTLAHLAVDSSAEDMKRNWRFFWHSLRPSHQHISREHVREALQDPRWRRAVVLRDPLERWLSAYQSKCMFGDHDGGLHCQLWLRLPNRSTVPSVALVASRMWAFFDSKPEAQCKWNVHWRPQHCFCGLNPHTLNVSWTHHIPFHSLSTGMRQLYSGRVPPTRLESLMNQTARLTIAPTGKLSRIHVTGGAEAGASKLDEATKAVVRHIYAADYQLFSRAAVNILRGSRI